MICASPTAFMTGQLTAQMPTATVPASLAMQLLALIKRWQVPADDLLVGTGLSESTLVDPVERLSISTMCALLERARTLTGEPGIGYYLGLEKRASVFGYLGFAAMGAPSLREALELAVRFAPLFSTALTVELQIDGAQAALVLRERIDLGSARDIVLISLTFGLETIGRALTQRDGEAVTELAIPQPHYYPRFAHLAPRSRFGQPLNRIVFAAAALDLPIPTADPTALLLARSLCERALDELGFDGDLVDRVRRLVPNEEGGFRSLDEVASCVRLSPRTLKRRLAAHGSSFSALVDRERRERALSLLRSSRLSIDDVAERLDYSTASTFVRAFHRWTGTTPAAYRRAKRRGATHQILK